MLCVQVHGHCLPSHCHRKTLIEGRRGWEERLVRELLLGVGNPPRYISEHLVVFKGFSRAQVRAGNSGAIKRILGRRRREQQP